MKQASSSPKLQSKKWLREASMNRLSTFMKNKTELIGNASQLGMGVIAVDDLEKSGLSPTEIHHLEQWVSGVETGRHCMLAILDERFNEKDVESSSSSSSTTFQPIELIKTSMNLPQDFLCDSGFVYETVFKRPPTSVIREALQMLSSKAYETNAQGLNAHQINIAIKQLRLDHLADDRPDASKSATESESGNDENVSQNTPRDSVDSKTTSEATSTAPSAPVAKASEHTFKLQVMIELIRMHIITNNTKLKQEQRSSSSASRSSSTLKQNWNPAVSSDSDSVSDVGGESDDNSDDGSQNSLDDLFDDLPEFIQKGLRQSKPPKSRSTKAKKIKKPPVDNRKNLFSKTSDASSEMKTQFARDLAYFRSESPSAEEAASSSSAGAAADRIDIRTLEYHLNTPLQAVQEQAENLTNEDIEYSNQLLKPYLKKLAALKSVLSTQLKDLQESRAYLCLGVTPDASDEAIKKAYRLMAIKLHPDKAGGSTVKFQQLQDHYHEILKRRQNNKTEKRAFSEVRKQEKTQQKQKTAAFKAAKGMMGEEDEGPELDTEDEELMSGEQKPRRKTPSAKLSTSDSESDSETVLDEEEEEGEKDSSVKKNKSDKVPTASKKSKKEAEVKSEDEDEEEDVEDVHISDHEDDDEVDPVTGETKRDQRAAAAAAAKAADKNNEYIRNKKRALKKQIKEGSYSSFTEFAQAIADSILELLVTIKQSANDITALAQYNIKLHKSVIKISSSQTHPLNIREIMKLMKSTSLSAILGGSSSVVGGAAQITSELCSLSNAIGPIELICELCQSICSSAMRLSSECGVHYAKQVATNRSFLATVEETMNNSLKSLKMVMQCMSSQDQFNSALRRVQDSFQLSLESEEISDLLIEMLTTALQSNVLTVTNTVDRIVETSLNVSNVYELVLETIKETEHQIQQQVKREASQRESDEAEEDFCEEDKELLRQSRANQRQQQQKDQQQQQGEKKNKDEEGKKNEKGKTEEEDEDENSLSNLKDKIRALQIQLRIQHIGTLQNMNKEILGLQSNIISEIKDLPFIQSWEALFKAPTGKESKKTAAATSNASEKNPSSDFHTSIMTLLSTLLDSSCLAIRDELKAAADLTTGHFFLRSDSHFRAVIVKHLSWTSITLNDGTKDLLTSHILSRLFPSVSAPLPDDSAAPSSSSAAGASAAAAPPASTFKARLAMYPEYRTKILYMASVVDVDTVKEIIGCELFQRLDELVFENNGQKRGGEQTSAPSSQPSTPPVKASSTVPTPSESVSPVVDVTVERTIPSPEVEEAKEVPVSAVDESFDIDCNVANVSTETGAAAESERLYDDVDDEIFSSYVSPAKSTSSGGFVHITSEQVFQSTENEEDEDKEDVTGNDDSEDGTNGSSYGEVRLGSPVSVEDTYEAPDTEVEGFSEDERPLDGGAALDAEEEECDPGCGGDREAEEVPSYYSYYQKKRQSAAAATASEAM